MFTFVRSSCVLVLAALVLSSSALASSRLKLEGFYSGLLKDGTVAELKELREAIDSNLQPINDANQVRTVLLTAQKNKGLVLFEAEESAESYLDLLSSHGVNIAKQIRDRDGVLTGIVVEKGAKLNRNDETLLSYRSSFESLLQKSAAKYFGKKWSMVHAQASVEFSRIQVCEGKQCSEIELPSGDIFQAGKK